jgi:hypothetical protein
MNNRTWVKLSNVIGLVAIIALVYWVFGFIVVEAFELRVFQKGTAEIFGMSILGVLALMAGALMINIMFNLTRIAEKHNQDETSSVKTSATRWIVFAASFPLILGLLFVGNYLSEQEKKAEMIADMEAIVANQTQIAQLADYRFDAKWIDYASDALQLHGKSMDIDMNLSKYAPANLAIITADTLSDARVFLSFPHWRETDEKETEAPLQKKDFILESSSEERAYFINVFDKGARDILFSADGNSFTLFYPYSVNGKTIILYRRGYEHYGRLGSS